MNSHPSWLKQEHDDEDPDEAYTAGDQLVYDNRRIRHLTQGFSTQQYQHLSTLGHLSPDPHPHHAVSSQNPLAYRPEYSQAQYHLQDSYSTGASLDDYSHYQANQVHFDEFAGIVPYNNHVMATPNATPAASPIISRLQLITSDGLPTERQFEYLVTEYITSLSVKKQDKALIPLSRYTSIKQVLSDPKCTTIESAQFRFWAKKMFTLSQTQKRDVCHEEKPVAVREDLYVILSNAHHSCAHGGRDKTSGQVRQHYSWVPKELIARFVKICPTCQMRRNPASVNSGTRIQMRPQTTMAQQYMPPELTPPGYIPPGINVAQPYTAAIYEQQYLGSASGVGIVDEAQNPPMPNNQNFRYPYQQNRR